MQKILHTAQALAILFCLYFSAAASGTVDQTFNPAASKDLAGSAPVGLTVQPDGKTIIWGWGVNYVVSGQTKGSLARLNIDGSPDNTFSYCGCLLGSINNAAVQADGKILIAGTDSASLPRIIRLNSDGSADNTYVNGLGAAGVRNGQAAVMMIQSDGKALVTASGEIGGGYHQGFLARLNTDGSDDATFTHNFYDSGRSITGYLRSVAVDSVGRVYLAITSYSGGYSSSYLRRLTSAGVNDTSWEIPAVSNISGSNTDFGSVDIDSSDRLLIGGRFDRVNGIDSLNLARILPAGNLDLTFTPPAAVTASYVSQVKSIADNKILINAGGQLYRLNSDGTIDNTFVFPTAAISAPWTFFVSASGQITFWGTSSTSQIRPFRLNPNGDMDTTFQPVITVFAQITAIALQADGKVILAGNFTQMNGVTRPTIARVNADGTTDTSFDPGTGFSSAPTSLVVQGDGKILAAGSFQTFNGVSRPSLLRLNSDGSLDAGFAPTVTQVNGVLLQSDGRILIYGGFSTVNGIAKTAVARLETNGALDTTFGVLFSAGATVNTMLQLSDGKFIAGGTFTGVDGFNRPNLVRLNSNGSLDQTFNATGVSTVVKVLVQPDGKYVVLTTNTLSRRNTDGTLDTAFGTHTFQSDRNTSGLLNAAVLQADGSIIIGGDFNTVDSTRRNHLVRFSSAGKLDLLFIPSATDQRVLALVMQPDAKVLVGGDYTRIGTSIRTGIARIVPGAFSTVTLFDFDGDGKADFTVLRPSITYWFQLRSSDGQVSTAQFYAPGDIPAPADYDGDGKTDYGVFRPSNGNWYYLSSANGGTYSVHWGQSGDIPFPGDADGDGRADFRLYRPSSSVWYNHLQSGLEPNYQFGVATDIPIVGDFDGDGKVDPAIFRPSTGDWWFRSSIDGSQRAFHWGMAGDIPATADFDGDGKSDCAVFRPSDRTWYILNSHDLSFTGLQFGLSDDKPVPADYDGDGKGDIAVWRPSSGTWYVMGSTSGFFGMQFGANGDIPAENSFVPQ